MDADHEIGTALPSAHAPRFPLTRIAPTPSGYLHLGNVLSFALTALLAQRYRARILLRIDDLDRDRMRPEYLQDIFDTLRFLDIAWHDGPQYPVDFETHWSQRHRLPHYNHILDRLREKEAVFACSCSRNDILAASPDGSYPGTCLHKSLPLEQPGLNWRLRTEDNRPVTVRTPGGSSSVFLPRCQEAFVVRKKDGSPSYQLASLADDYHFGTGFIVRGADLWDSTLAQLYLARALGYDDFAATLFYHHPLLLAPGGQKLSKSAGAASIKYMRENGRTPAEIWQEIARQSGIMHPVDSWQELAITILAPPSTSPPRQGI